jgi:hypothetical protein
VVLPRLPMLKRLDWEAVSQDGLLLGLHHLVPHSLKKLGITIPNGGNASGAAHFLELVSPRLDRLELCLDRVPLAEMPAHDDAVRLVRQFSELEELWLNDWIVSAILKSDPCLEFSSLHRLEIKCTNTLTEN